MASEEERRQERDFVTRLELIQSQHDLKQDVTNKIDDVDRKVDTLNDIVLPLVESSRQTAKNTDRMANSFDSFADEQRRTNGKFYDRLHDHELSLNSLGEKTKSQTEEKKVNAKITIAVISFLTAIIGGIFGLAPYLFG